ncbi:hypothetical protein [Undibacterium sp. TJN19]|uniref:hypothetical protein n=1 Tax=Undibacterium sp. TJN19 TaxID=3413055 RepID=UPI003BF3B09C
MFTRSHGIVICTLMLSLMLGACSERKSSHTVREVTSSKTFYPRNEGCTFDGVAGSVADINQMHNAKVISDACFVTPKETANNSNFSGTLYTTNPGCKIDGVSGADATTEQILHSTVISDECLVPPEAKKT